MIRRMRHSLSWVGAVLAVLMLALPVQADDIEPEPYVEEEVMEPEPEPEPEPVVEEEAEPEIAEEPSRNIEKFFDLGLDNRLGLGLHHLFLDVGLGLDVIGLHGQCDQ
jgi:hypothetical protein